MKFPLTYKLGKTSEGISYFIRITQNSQFFSVRYGTKYSRMDQV